jgi:hypothetical protein
MKVSLGMLCMLAGVVAFFALPGLGAEPKSQPVPGYVVVLDDSPGGQAYRAAAEELSRWRAAIRTVPLTAEGLGPVFEQLKQLKPQFVAFVVSPGRIEDNFVGEVFQRTSRLEDGPELDFAYGFITGATLADALALVRNTERAESDRASIPKRFVAVGHTFAESDLGPFAYQQALLFEQYGYQAWPMNPIDNSVDWRSRLPWEMRQLRGASLVVFAGHGMGDWMCGLDADAFTGVQLDRAIVVSGPCHSAVTTLRHDNQGGALGVKSVPIPPERSICLQLVRAGAIAQLGSTASSCWANVGAAVPAFFNQGQTLGEALRHRLNDYIRQNGIRQFTSLPFEDGKPSPQFLKDERNPANIQSLARVMLIGDPAYRPFPEKRPELPLPVVAERPHPLQAAAPAPPPVSKPASKALAQASVEELVATMTQNPSPDFAELNELTWRGPSAVPALVAALQGSESWLVPKALGTLKDARAVDPLIAALARREVSPYKEVTVEALESITGQKAGADAQAWKSWRAKHVP